MQFDRVPFPWEGVKSKHWAPYLNHLETCGRPGAKQEAADMRRYSKMSPDEVIREIEESKPPFVIKRK